jgi:flagellin
MNVSEQTTAARSRIEDADFATESAVLAKSQVLQQSGAAMLAQANARPQLVLQLIK